MFRYLAMFWDEHDVHARATARHLMDGCRARLSDWNTTLYVPGIVVLSAGMPVVGKIAGSGGSSCLVLGDLFRGANEVDGSDEQVDASARGSVVSLDAVTMARVQETRGRVLVHEYWGNYVALGRNSDARDHWVLRGPASAVPCLCAQFGGVDLYFSWMEACARLGALSFSINWKYVARSLVGPVASPHTGLDEVTEILPGFCEELRGPERTRRCYWNPVAQAQREPITDFNLAAHQLHAVTLASIQAWAERTPKLLHGLSGGLDSSIVLACLRQAPTRPEITALTYFAEGSDSDEREFARCAARAVCCRHVECHRDDSNLDLRSAVMKVRLERSSGLRVPQIDRIEPELARSMGANAIYKGHGGDELFCRHHTLYYLADALRAGRLDSFGLLLHAAVTEGETVWAAAAKALTHAYLPRRWNPMKIFRRDQAGQSFLRDDVWHELQEDASLDLPYACSTRECPPGKLWQISLVMGWRPYFTPSTLEDDPPLISPLLSQPIIEVGLRIPTYLQMHGRRERAVARAAFEQEVPREILERSWKGGSEQLAWKLFRRNLPFIRELLLDGQLVRQGIVDRQRLEAALCVSCTSTLTATVPVFELVGAEIWLQGWMP